MATNRKTDEEAAACPRPPGETVCVERFGQGVQVTPAFPELLEPLRTEVRVPGGRRPEGVGLRARQEPLYRVGRHNNQPSALMRAGLKAIVRHLIEEAGFQTVTRGIDALPSVLPDVDSQYVRRFGPVDEGLLAFCKEHDLGQISYDKQRVDPVWLAAQLAIAFPHARMAAVTASADHARQFAERIRRWIPGTEAVTAKHAPRRMGRVIVSTIYGLGHCEIEKLDLVLMLRATDAIHKRGLFVLQHARRARMYGFLDVGTKIAPRDRDWLTAVFGPAELQIPQHGHRAIQINVIWAPVKAAALPVGMAASNLKAKGIEQHPIRNRRIGRMATAIADNDPALLAKDYPNISSILNGRSNSRVVILVASVNHALALALGARAGRF